MKAWTTVEIALLRENASLGVTRLASLLQRSEPSILRAAHRHRVSLRTPGERRGSVLGQPRGISLKRRIREDIVSGAVDATVLAERMRLDAEAELCPCCGIRPVRVPSTGMCRACHLSRLADLHREALAECAAQQELWRERQALHRAREQVGV